MSGSKGGLADLYLNSGRGYHLVNMLDLTLLLKSGPREIHILPCIRIGAFYVKVDDIKTYFTVIFDPNKRVEPKATELSPIFFSTQRAGKGDCDITGRVPKS